MDHQQAGSRSSDTTTTAPKPSVSRRSFVKTLGLSAAGASIATAAKETAAAVRPPDAPTAADVPGSYDASQTLVLSFTETSGIPADATAYKNNPSASTAVLTPAAIIGGGAKFAGKESITIPATPSLRLLPNQGFTASAWLRVANAQTATVFALPSRQVLPESPAPLKIVMPPISAFWKIVSRPWASKSVV